MRAGTVGVVLGRRRCLWSDWPVVWGSGYLCLGVTGEGRGGAEGHMWVIQGACENCGSVERTEERKGRLEWWSDADLRKERKRWQGYLREVLDAALGHSEEHQCGILNTGTDPSTWGTLFIQWDCNLFCLTTLRATRWSLIKIPIYSTNYTHLRQSFNLESSVLWQIYSATSMHINVSWQHCWSSSDHGELVHVRLQCTKTCKSKTSHAGMYVRQEAQLQTNVQMKK